MARHTSFERVTPLSSQVECIVTRRTTQWTTFRMGWVMAFSDTLLSLRICVATGGAWAFVFGIAGLRGIRYRPGFKFEKGDGSMRAMVSMLSRLGFRRSRLSIKMLYKHHPEMGKLMLGQLLSAITNGTMLARNRSDREILSSIHRSHHHHHHHRHHHRRRRRRRSAHARLALSDLFFFFFSPSLTTTAPPTVKPTHPRVRITQSSAAS